MKVALVSPYDYPYPGGVTAHISHLASNFAELGHEVTIVAPSSDPNPARFAGQNVVVIGKPVSIPANGSVARITLSLRLAGKVKHLLREERFDIVHLHEPLLPALPIQVLRFSESTNIGTFHAYSASNIGYFYGKRILKRWFRKLDGKIAVSRPAMEFVSRYFPGYYNIIPNGIDYERFAAEVAPLPELCDGKFNILFVGRLERRKGFKYLLRAYAGLKREHKATRLIVIGPEGKAKAAYETAVQQSGLTDVVFAGHVSHEELPRYYKSANLFCSPATGQESFGIVLLEAMASGTPLLASNIEGYASLIDDGVDGVLVEPKSAQALAAAMSDLMSDERRLREMAEAGRRKAQEYSWKKVSRRVLAYYERLLSEKYPRAVALEPRLRAAEA